MTSTLFAEGHLSPAAANTSNCLFGRFEKLPPELILQVMVSVCGDKEFQDLKNLVLASKSANKLWRSRKGAIFNALLARFPDFDGYFGPMPGFGPPGQELPSYTNTQRERLAAAITDYLDGFAMSTEKRIPHYRQILLGGFSYLSMLKAMATMLDEDVRLFYDLGGCRLLKRVHVRRAMAVIYKLRWHITWFPTILSTPEVLRAQKVQRVCDCWPLVRGESAEVLEALRDIFTVRLREGCYHEMLALGKELVESWWNHVLWHDSNADPAWRDEMLKWTRDYAVAMAVVSKIRWGLQHSSGRASDRYAPVLWHHLYHDDLRAEMKRDMKSAIDFTRRLGILSVETKNEGQLELRFVCTSTSVSSEHVKAAVES